jgi:NAD(P)-dependent dehydrogenase (short-subunit alcohol dehydrogenase family)
VAINETWIIVMASSPLASSSLPALAVVTGACSGIGQALTAVLLKRGLDVVAIDRDASTADVRTRGFSLDVRDAAGMAHLAEQFAHRPARYVFANAGIGGAPGDALGLADEAWQWAWDVNFLGALRTLRLWWPHLLAGRGKAVATLSAAALTSFPGAGPYRASKAALLAALEGFHYQAQGTGVSVHALCPGLVRTDILDLQRYPEAAPLLPPSGTPPNPFTAHVARAMHHAEPASDFAERVLQGLDQGAPFYWLTHPESHAWIESRHKTIERNLPPFNDFGAPT